MRLVMLAAWVVLLVLALTPLLRRYRLRGRTAPHGERRAGEGSRLSDVRRSLAGGQPRDGLRPPSFLQRRVRGSLPRLIPVPCSAPIPGAPSTPSPTSSSSSRGSKRAAARVARCACGAAFFDSSPFRVAAACSRWAAAAVSCSATSRRWWDAAARPSAWIPAGRFSTRRGDCRARRGRAHHAAPRRRRAPAVFIRPLRRRAGHHRHPARGRRRWRSCVRWRA